jgi:hypothetical protein
VGDTDWRAAREAVEAPWDELREARNLKGVLAARQRVRQLGDVESASAVQRWAVWLALAGAVVVTGLIVVGIELDRDDGERPGHAATQPIDEEHVIAPTNDRASPPAETAETSTVTLPDGGHVRLQPGARIELLEDGVVQSSGRARYMVAREPTRPLEIVLDKVSLRVAAAVFEAAIDVHHVDLIVLEGRVELREDGRWVVLEHGGEAHIPREPHVPLAPDEPEHEKPRTAEIEIPSAAELMQRVDQARSEGRLDDATVDLRTLVEQHGQSTHVGAALFTLAQLESKRGRHQAAAAAFAEHSRRFPNDPLSEDALAGAATQSVLAGAANHAREFAQEYLERFPGGIHQTRMLDLLATN